MPQPLPDNLRDLRRMQIVREARVLIANGGLSALTIGALEQRLTFTRGVITHHFRDKDDIVSAVLESAVAEIDAATDESIQSSTDFEAKVTAVVRTKITGFLENREASWILLAFWGQIRFDPSARQQITMLFAGYRQQSAQLIEWGMTEGVIPRDLDVDAVAVVLVGAVIGVVTQVMLSANEINVDAAVDTAARIFRAGMNSGCWSGCSLVSTRL